jgi:periplasmic protein TonB
MLHALSLSPHWLFLTVFGYVVCGTDAHAQTSIGKSEDRQPAFEYFEVDSLPTPVGKSSDLNAALREVFEWPAACHAEGFVYLEFVIGQNGRLQFAKLIRGIAEPCDEAALKALATFEEWLPGRIDREAVSTRMYLRFRVVLR